MNELILTAKIKVMIRKEFPGTYVQRVSDRFLSGIPDLRIVCFGLSADIEIKMPGCKTSPIQDIILQKISAAGGACAVVKSVEEARVFMHRLYRKGRVHHESSICQNS